MEIADRRPSVLLDNIKPVRCSDSGLYSCEVEGTDQHRTVTMLVRCKYDTVTGRYRCKYAMIVGSAGINIQCWSAVQVYVTSDCGQYRYQYIVTVGSTGKSMQ